MFPISATQKWQIVTFRPKSFDHPRMVYQDRIFFIPGRVRYKINFCPTVHRTWKNRHLVLTWFLSSSTALPLTLQCILFGSKESRWKCGGLEWNRRNCAGIGTEPGCLFLHVPSTRFLPAPISLFDIPFLLAKSRLKEGRPWMTFLSRSNEGRLFFQFAIEYSKRRSLTSKAV